MRIWFLLLIPILSVACPAQNAKPGSGAVTGHVYCADTNAPARMASVQLKPVRASAGRSDEHSRDNGEPVGGVVETTLDGSFLIPNVPPGSYYVEVMASGYLTSLPDDEKSDDSQPQPTSGQDAVVIPKVDVQPDQTANIDVRLERGSAISGTIRFDDGSPATNVMVMLQRKSKNKWVALPNGDYGAFAMPSSLMADDLGHYRISGLHGGEYLLTVTLVHIEMMPAGAHREGLSGNLRSVLIVYSGDTMHKSEAASIKLGSGEDRAGVDVTIPLSKLHSVSGVVTAASDGHAVNSGHLTIEDAVDKESVVEAEVDRDGAFHLDGVPEGSYVVHVQNASDKETGETRMGGEHHVAVSEDKTIHEYGDLEQPIKIEGDVPNLVLSVPEKKKQPVGAVSQ